MVRRPLRIVLRPLLLLLALAWVPFAVAAAVDLDWWWPVPAGVAFLPYGVVFTALVAVACWLLGSRLVALVAIAGLVVLVAPRAGRFTSDGQPRANGARLVVATSNVYVGRADARALTQLVRVRRVDVLALQEDNQDFTGRLAAAGLRQELPYGVLQPAPHAAGLSVYSRYPIARVAPRTAQDTRSVGGVITLPTSERIQVRAVHPYPPFNQPRMRLWKRTTRALSSAAGPRATGGAPTIFAGDFNATLDHHPLRALMDRGYRDAADQVGAAWRPTWSDGRFKTLTLDHVLVPARVAVERVRIQDLAGSDHDVVVSTLRLRG